jgi:hypothetical protein
VNVEGGTRVPLAQDPFAGQTLEEGRILKQFIKSGPLQSGKAGDGEEGTGQLPTFV